MDFRVLTRAALLVFALAAPALAQTINITGTLTSPSGGATLFSTTVSATTDVTMGQTAVLPEVDSGNANLLVAQQAVLSEAATLQTMSFYVVAAAGQLQLGVYDASGPGGNPGQKVAETAPFTPVAGWNTQPVVAPVGLGPGTYWLAYLPSDGGLSFVKGAGSAVWFGYSFADMPAAFATAGVDSGTVQWSMYATLQASLLDYTVAASASPAAGGTVTGSGTFPLGSIATVVATPTAGYAFVNWTEGGAVVSATPSYSFTVASVVNVPIVANFALVQQGPFTVDVIANPTEGGTVTGAGTYPGGASATVTATPN